MKLLADVGNTALVTWQNFYVIVGSTGGALVGLQFVVIALIAGVRRRIDPAALNAFGTPTVVHFGGALALSAIMSAPWPSLIATSVALVIFGVGSSTYAVIVFRRARQQTDYKPVPEDWIWYVILPCVIHVAVTLSALLLTAVTRTALFVVGGAALSLLLIGIHNAWDSVTHVVVVERATRDGPS